jgi:putative membrane protein
MKCFFASTVPGFLIACLGMMQSCDNIQTKKTDSIDSAKLVNDSIRKNPGVFSSPPTVTGKDAADFSVKAASENKMQLVLGAMAMNKAYSRRVKDFGAMVVKDFTKADSDLVHLAATAHIVLPVSVSSDAQHEIDVLGQQSGDAFDKKYMKLMLKNHQEQLTAYREVADKSSDSSVKVFAHQVSLILEKQLDSAQAITGKIKPNQ